MNKFILAFTLVLTPFFSAFYVFADVVEPDSVSPKVTIATQCLHNGGTILSIADGDGFEACRSFFESHHRDGDFATLSSSDTFCEELDSYWSINEYKIEYKSRPYVGSACVNYGVSSNKYKIGGQVLSKSCPPDEYPAFTYSKDTNDDGEIDICYKDNPNLEKCPNGNYEFAISDGSGGSMCVPVKCDAAGTSKHNWVSGSVYNNTGGTYCDGSCAHNVSGGQNDGGYKGNVAISTVATGRVCGQGQPKDQWHVEGGEENCSNIDGLYTCSNGSDPEAEPDPEPEPPIDNEPSKASDGDIPVIEPAKESCSEGDASCEIRNLKEKLESESTEQKKQDIELHNKEVDVQTKNAIKLIDTIKNANDRTADGLKMVTDAVTKGSETGSGGGGGDSDEGVCDVDGNCSTSIETKTEPSEGLTGFWVSEYENGLQGVFDEKLIDIKQTEFYGFLDQFNPSISGGSAPSYNFCFNIGAMGNFGCHDFNIDPRVFPAVRIFILITAGFLCRKILFGG